MQYRKAVSSTRSGRCRRKCEYGMRYGVHYSFDMIFFKARQKVPLPLLLCISITLVKVKLCLPLLGQWPIGKKKHDSSLTCSDLDEHLRDQRLRGQGNVNLSEGFKPVVTSRNLRFQNSGSNI